jgi:hypothetical protein
MQDTKRFEDQHPAAGPGLSGGALGSLRKGGVREQGSSEQRRLARSVTCWHEDGDR